MYWACLIESAVQFDPRWRESRPWNLLEAVHRTCRVTDLFVELGWLHCCLQGSLGVDLLHWKAWTPTPLITVQKGLLARDLWPAILYPPQAPLPIYLIQLNHGWPSLSSVHRPELVAVISIAQLANCRLERPLFLALLQISHTHISETLPCLQSIQGLHLTSLG